MSRMRVARPAQRSRLSQMQANIVLAASSFGLLCMYSMSPADKGDRMILPGSDFTENGDDVLQIDQKSADHILPVCSDAEGHRCQAWADSGECEKNPGSMYYSCLSSCGGCERKYVHSVSRHVELQPGLVIPSIGFGTAGLGEQTTAAVLAALDAGYRRIDTAQAREWQVCHVQTDLFCNQPLFMTVLCCPS